MQTQTQTETAESESRNVHVDREIIERLQYCIMLTSTVLIVL